MRCSSDPVQPPFTSIQLHHSPWWKEEAGYTTGSPTPLLSPSPSALIVFSTSALPTGQHSTPSLSMLIPGSTISTHLSSSTASAVATKVRCSSREEKPSLQHCYKLQEVPRKLEMHHPFLGLQCITHAASSLQQLPTEEQSLDTDHLSITVPL